MAAAATTPFHWRVRGRRRRHRRHGDGGNDAVSAARKTAEAATPFLRHATWRQRRRFSGSRDGGGVNINTASRVSKVQCFNYPNVFLNLTPLFVGHCCTEYSMVLVTRDFQFHRDLPAIRTKPSDTCHVDLKLSCPCLYLDVLCYVEGLLHDACWGRFTGHLIFYLGFTRPFHCTGRPEMKDALGGGSQIQCKPLNPLGIHSVRPFHCTGRPEMKDALGGGVRFNVNP